MTDSKTDFLDPVTKTIVADIAIRMGERVLRGVRLSSSAKKLGVGRPSAIAGAVIARVATRSVPGALLVSGGLVAKALYVRKRDRRKARKAGKNSGNGR